MGAHHDIRPCTGVLHPEYKFKHKNIQLKDTIVICRCFDLHLIVKL